MTEWINIKDRFPTQDRILCTGKGQVFICELIESKWGNRYHWTENKSLNEMPEITHWIPLPEPPNV